MGEAKGETHSTVAGHRLRSLPGQSYGLSLAADSQFACQTGLTRENGLSTGRTLGIGQCDTLLTFTPSVPTPCSITHSFNLVLLTPLISDCRLSAPRPHGLSRQPGLRPRQDRFAGVVDIGKTTYGASSSDISLAGLGPGEDPWSQGPLGMTLREQGISRYAGVYRGENEP